MNNQRIIYIHGPVGSYKIKLDHLYVKNGRSSESSVEVSQNGDLCVRMWNGGMHFIAAGQWEEAQVVVIDRNDPSAMP